MSPPDGSSAVRFCTARAGPPMGWFGHLVPGGAWFVGPGGFDSTLTARAGWLVYRLLGFGGLSVGRPR
mgnify:CR=1 FL=1